MRLRISGAVMMVIEDESKKLTGKILMYQPSWPIYVNIGPCDIGWAFD